MKAVYKYPVTARAMFGMRTVVNVPEDAELLDAQFQHEHITLWFLVDPSAPPEPRAFFLAATGTPYAALDESADYVATIQIPHNGLVVHLFEVDPPEAT